MIDPAQNEELNKLKFDKQSVLNSSFLSETSTVVVEKDEESFISVVSLNENEIPSDADGDEEDIDAFELFRQTLESYINIENDTAVDTVKEKSDSNESSPEENVINKYFDEEKDATTNSQMKVKEYGVNCAVDVLENINQYAVCLGHVKSREQLIPYLVQMLNTLYNFNASLVTTLIKKAKDLIRLMGGIS